MFEEHTSTRGPKSPCERILLWQTGLLIVFSGWAFGGNIPWAPGYLAMLGWLSVIILLIYRFKYQNNSRRILTRYILWMMPVWVSGVLFLWGLKNPALHSTEIGGSMLTWIQLPQNSWMPVNLAPDATWMPWLLLGGIYSTAVAIILIVESRFIVHQLLRIGVLSTAGHALFGFFLMLFESEKMLGVYTVSHPQAFGLFPHPAHWAAYALLWTGVVMALLLKSGIRAFDRSKPVDQILYSACVLLLTASLLAAGPIALWMGWAGLAGCTALASGLLLYNQTTHPRIIMATTLTTLGLVFIVTAMTGTWAAQAYDLSHINPLVNNISSLSPEETKALRRDGWRAFEERPWTGWGQGSTPAALSIYNQVDLTGDHYASPRSDLLQSLIEHGVVGTIVWWLLPITVVGQTLIRRRPAPAYILTAVIVIAAAAMTFGFPLRSPAFLCGFWVITGCCYRMNVLSRKDQSKRNRKRPSISHGIVAN
jgi:hypothetical protein